MSSSSHLRWPTTFELIRMVSWRRPPSRLQIMEAAPGAETRPRTRLASVKRTSACVRAQPDWMKPPRASRRKAGPCGWPVSRGGSTWAGGVPDLWRLAGLCSRVQAWEQGGWQGVPLSSSHRLRYWGALSPHLTWPVKGRHSPQWGEAPVKPPADSSPKSGSDVDSGFVH